MTEITYTRQCTILIAAALILPLFSAAIDWAPAGDARFFGFFALIGAIHATSTVLSLRHRATLARGTAFVALAAFLSLVTPFLGFVVTPVLPFVVPLVLRLLPFLKAIGDSTAGDSVRFLFIVTGASACGASGYWLLVRWFWLEPLRFVDFFRTVTLCVVATSLAFVIPGVLTSMNREVAGYLPTVLWWFAFSGSLYWSESSGNYHTHIPTPTFETV
jgi:hypothetical protein